MTMMRALQQMLWANASFRASSSAGIDAVLAPERPQPADGGPLPVFTTYHRVGGSGKQTFDSAGTQKLRVQFNFHSGSYDLSDAAHEALRNVLERFSGMLADGTIILQAIYIQPIDGYDNEPRQFTSGCEFYLLYNLN